MGKLLGGVRTAVAVLARPDASDWLIGVGAVVLSAGIGLIYAPAGLIAAGVLLMACGFLIAAGSKRDAARP